MRSLPLFSLLSAVVSLALSQDLPERTREALAFSRSQAHETLRWLGDSIMYPRSTGADGRWICTKASSWTSGFFPGILWQLGAHFKDRELLDGAQALTDGLSRQQWNTGTHDVGFILMSSYGHRYRLHGSPEDRDVLLHGAASLATRYRPVVGCIKSWDWSKEWQFPVIIDNLMNLELLFWASSNGGSEHLRDIAMTHAAKTIDNHLRPDGSSFHVVNYDTLTGQVISRITHQGASDTSTWARGQAWAVYGFSMAYRETRDGRFLDAAKKAAEYYLSHLGAEVIPFWDFQAPDIPRAPRDASAAAIACSGLFELSELAGDSGGRYRQAAERTLLALCQPPYLASGSPSSGILLHAVGNMPRNQEVDVSLIYADYYFVESILRYVRLHDTDHIE